MEFPRLLISGCYNAFSEGYNGSGIYGFSGLAPSSFKVPIYVGSTDNLKIRIITNHIPQLIKKDHTNKPLENYIFKNGWENVVVFHLEECAPENNFKIEQKYIDYYGTASDFKSFNICDKAGSGPRMQKENHPMWGISRPELGVKNKERCAKPFKLLSPSGEIIEGVNLAEFAIENGLNRANLSKVIHSKCKQCKGWRNADSPDFSVNKGELRPFVFKSPDQKIINGVNLNNFCRINGLDHGAMIKVRDGKASHHKGWTKAE